MKLRNKKTGDIVEIKTIDLVVTGQFCDKIIDRQPSLAKLNTEWEDYEPQEPLIKDENIRKAVKAWAYVNGVKTATYDELPYDRGLNTFFFEDDEKENAIIQFYGWIPTLKEGETHTLAELCGEEE